MAWSNSRVRLPGLKSGSGISCTYSMRPVVGLRPTKVVPRNPSSIPDIHVHPNPHATSPSLMQSIRTEDWSLVRCRGVTRFLSKCCNTAAGPTIGCGSKRSSYTTLNAHASAKALAPDSDEKHFRSCTNSKIKSLARHRRGDEEEEERGAAGNADDDCEGLPLSQRPLLLLRWGRIGVCINGRYPYGDGGRSVDGEILSWFLLGRCWGTTQAAAKVENPMGGR